MGGAALNIAILDDAAADRDKASSCLLNYFSSHPAISGVSIYEFESGEAFLQAFTPRFYQFILIDCYMDGISGLETAKLIRKSDKHAILIFITASRDYAIDGYKVQASGYLTKPFTYDALEEIMTLIDINKLRDEEFIQLDAGSCPVRILLHDIIYCDIAGHYVQVHTRSTEVLRFRMAFAKLSSMLKPFEHFLFCYRGCIVNMNHIFRVEQLDFIMANGDRIPFRKKDQALIMAAYTEFLFKKVRGSQH